MVQCNNKGTCWKTYTITLGKNKVLNIRKIVIKKGMGVPENTTYAKIMYQSSSSSGVELLYQKSSNNWGFWGEVTYEVNRQFNKPGVYYIQGMVAIGTENESKFEDWYTVIVDYEIISEGDSGGKPIEEGDKNKTPILGDLQELWKTINTAAKIIVIMVVIAVFFYLGIPKKAMELKKGGEK